MSFRSWDNAGSDHGAPGTRQAPSLRNIRIRRRFTGCESFPSQGHQNMVTDNQERFFFQHYGLTNHDLEIFLDAALSAGGDYADLYFEYLTSTSLMVDESLVKSASQGISAGRGVRGVFGGLRRACRFRRAHRIRLHRRSFSAADFACCPYGGIDRERPRKDDGRGISAETGPQL